jgi:hypothetical protein
MKTIVTFLKTLALVLICSLGGCAAGGALGSAQGSPSATQWQQIPDPPEKPVRIAHIGGLGRDAKSLFVDTASGKQYECCGLWSNVWKEADWKRTREGDSCPSLQQPPLTEAPGKVVDCAYVTQWEWATEEHYVVLLEDGSLWRWRFYASVADAFQGMMWGALIGFAAGLFIAGVRKRNQDP